MSAQLSTAVFSPYFSANLGLDIFFSGQEKDKYKTGLVGLTWNQQMNKNLRLKWMISSFSDNESQNYDITGDYLFGERDFDKTSTDFGKIVNPLGVGSNQNFARDNLNIHLYSFAHKGYLNKGNQFCNGEYLRNCKPSRIICMNGVMKIPSVIPCLLSTRFT